MRILGIDPGIATVGFGVIDFHANKFVTVEYGAVLSPADAEMPARLKMVYDDMSYIVDKYKPDEVAVEELFFNTNVKTAIMVGQARGVLMLSAANRGVPVYEYTPLQVKQAVVGYGRAEKTQVQQMVKAILGLCETPKPDDTADALAVAICHAHSGAARARLLRHTGGKLR
ncbi:MAG: crossover junction endodeoxyribonuclease RuvC [Clostridiales bacterium]|jgi:crossover junction endodeoxyribonuclease RuvC|nr:crossover junction endodeoxyribonuclease RuvC [Clostridiales bacterium]